MMLFNEMMNNIPSRIGENCTNTTSTDEMGKLPPAFGRIQRSSNAKWKIVYRAPRCMHRSRCLDTLIRYRNWNLL